MTITDPIEKIVAAALNRAGIVYRHESEGGQRLDFYLPVDDVYIEVKALHSPRIAAQMGSVTSVIAIQGRGAALAFARMLGGSE